MDNEPTTEHPSETKKGRPLTQSKRKHRELAPDPPSPSPTFTVRPTQELLPRLQQLAREMGRSEAQVMQESVSDLLEMIEGGYDFVPSIVQRARLWRENASGNQKRQLGSGGIPSYARDEIFPSECVRNLSPDLVFLPVYDDFGSWLMDSGESLDGKFGTAYRPSEIVGIPSAKARRASFGIKIDLSQQRRAIDGVQPSQRSGDILLVAQSQELQQFLPQYKETKTDSAWKHLEFLDASRSILIGSHSVHGAFLAILHLPNPNQEDQLIWLEVPTPGKATSSIGILLEECDAVGVVVHQILVPGSNGLSL